MKIWYNKITILNILMLPLSLLWLLGAFFRQLKPSYQAHALVVCVGNVVVGGAGKTPMVIYLAQKLQQQGYKVYILSRGYKGSYRGLAKLVRPHSSPAEVGDEPCLMAQYAPVMIASNRGVGAEALSYLGAEIILLDDGLQDNTLHKDLSFLVFNSAHPWGNQLVLPVGPLREPLSWALARANVAVAIGPTNPLLKKSVERYKIPYFEAGIVLQKSPSAPGREALADSRGLRSEQRLFAFTGIAHPSKFYNTLQEANYQVIKTRSFPDHYCYSEDDLQELIYEAQAEDLELITTSKDYVKIPAHLREMISELPVELNLNPQAEEEILQLVTEAYHKKFGPLK